MKRICKCNQTKCRKSDDEPEVPAAGRPFRCCRCGIRCCFPMRCCRLTVGRESSIQLIQSLGEEKTILVVAQRDARQDTPEAADLHHIGTRATVHKVVKMPNQSLFVFTEGNERVRWASLPRSAVYDGGVRGDGGDRAGASPETRRCSATW
jgi:hypothetical protein